jgi:hypothetical protein
MGVLYYVQRSDDDSRELFALNKVYRYMGSLIDDYREYREVEDEARFVDRFAAERRDWGARVHRRLLLWANGRRVRVLSENALDDIHDDLSYEEHRGKITGSAHDEDYESDGLAYKPNSAW